MEPAVIWELVLRGIALGALAATAAGLWRSGLVAIRIAGLLLTVSAGAYVLNSSAPVREALGAFGPLVHLFAFGGAGCFWLFIVTLFEDRPISPLTLAPAGVLTLVGVLAWMTRQDVSSPIWIGHNLFEAALAVHALFVIARSRQGDLVEARRRLRGPVLAVVTIYVLVLSAFEIGEGMGLGQPWFSLLGALALGFMCSLGAVAFLQAKPDLFGGAAIAQAPSAALDAGDQVLVTRLAEAMDRDEAWRREGLTIGALASDLDAPEHRLRRLINDRLGHRNFAAFVNARRIEAAKRMLVAPEKARTTIAAIAYDLGFGSLGPFNRAFKEATGLTPTEFRRGQSSPNPENPL